MDQNNVPALVQYFSFFRSVASIISATFCIYFGYKLFYLTESKGGDFEASASWGKVRLSQAAPGVFFTLFGSLVLISAQFKSPEFREREQETSQVSRVTENDLGTSQNNEGNAENRTMVSSREVVSSGAVRIEIDRIDFAACANSANYAVGVIQADEAFSENSAELIRKKFLHEKVESLAPIVGYCIDQQLGRGAFTTYKKISAMIKIGAMKDASEKDRKIFFAVKDILDK